MQFEAKIDYKNLKDIAKALTRNFKIKVGLLAEKGGSDTISDNLDLAGLGAIQEFGCEIPVTEKMRGYLAANLGLHLKKSTTHIIIPSRSFLQMPLEKQNELKKRLVKKIGSKEDILYYIKKTNDLESVAILLGASAVELIQEAFDTGGFGEWKPNNQLTVKGKGSNMPLVDTGNLRQHITFEVERE